MWQCVNICPCFEQVCLGSSSSVKKVIIKWYKLLNSNIKIISASLSVCQPIGLLYRGQMFKVQFKQVWNDDIVEKDNSVADTIYLSIDLHIYTMYAYMCVCMRASIDLD